MQTVQEQDKNQSGAYSVCCEAAIPGAGVDEYCGEDVYEEERC